MLKSVHFDNVTLQSLGISKAGKDEWIESL